ncbi:transmembrane protein 17B-like [Guaruba guarouba]
MAAHTPLPPNLRRGLVAFSGSLFIDNKTQDSGAAQRGNPAHELLASLPLQMMLYFNACYFPVWCLAEGMMLQLKYHLLPGHYQFLLVTTFLILLLVEGSRLYLGYMGNLQEKVSTTSALVSSPLVLVRDGADLSTHHNPFLLESCLDLSWEESTGAGRTWRQVTRDPLTLLLYPSLYQGRDAPALGFTVSERTQAQPRVAVMSQCPRCQGEQSGIVASASTSPALLLQVPELAGFLLLSFLIQLPLLLFLLMDSQVLCLPLELAVHSLLLAFLLAEITAAFLALRIMSKQLAAQFYLRRWKEGGRGMPGQADREGPCCRTPPAHAVSPSREY